MKVHRLKHSLLSSRRKGQRGLTLLELIVVIFIILILAVVLVIAILQAWDMGKSGSTRSLFNDIDDAMERWRAYHRKGGEHFPGDLAERSVAGNGRFEGNIALYEELVTIPKNKGLAPFYRGNLEEHTGVAEGSGKKLFVDGWGTPIIYWEWSSVFGAESFYIDPREGLESANKSNPNDQFHYARNRGSYDLYSAGGDDFGNDNDMVGGSAEKVAAPVND